MSLPIDITLIPKPTLGKDATQYYNQLIEIKWDCLKKLQQKPSIRPDQCKTEAWCEGTSSQFLDKRFGLTQQYTSKGRSVCKAVR